MGNESGSTLKLPSEEIDEDEDTNHDLIPRKRRRTEEKDSSQHSRVSSHDVNKPHKSKHTGDLIEDNDVNDSTHNSDIPQIVLKNFSKEDKQDKKPVSHEVVKTASLDYMLPAKKIPCKETIREDVSSKRGNTPPPSNLVGVGINTAHALSHQYFCFNNGKV